MVYDDQVVREICPAWLSMVSALGVQPPLDLGRPLVWLDVGCGTGLMTCAVAAGHPNVEVWGVDFNPAHVERARKLAEAAELANATFIEADFATMVDERSLGPTEVDIIVVNGVYSWVSARTKRNIVEIISRRLAPGGLALVMYEAATGWSSMEALAEALRLTVDADGREAVLAFGDAAAALTDFAAAGAGYFPMGNRETRQMHSWADLEGGLGAHEYLGAHFKPLDVQDVHEAMAGAKCSFIGGVHPLDRHAHYSVPPGYADVLAASRDPLSREMIRDLALQTALRSDVFRRGLAAVTPAEHDAALRCLEIGGLGRDFEDTPIELPAMQVALDPRFHRPLVEALGSGRLTAGDLLTMHPAWSLDDATTAMALLVAGQYATPVVPGGVAPGSVDACRRLNRVLGRERRLGRQHGWIAAPATGTMVALDLVEVLALDGIWAGVTPEVGTLRTHVIECLTGQGMTVRHEGQLIWEPEAAAGIVHERVAHLVRRLPALDALGVT
ncbi:MAG: class I SAM-dependent methyltransferase [Microthrixaceae bacterium]